MCVYVFPFGFCWCERTVHREDAEVGRGGHRSGSCGNQAQWLVAFVVWSAHKSLICWLAAGVCTRAVGFHHQLSCS